jgi:hypothetical protein
MADRNNTRRQQILDFIKAHTREQGYPPDNTAVTIGIGVPECQRGNVFTLVSQLIDEGYIVKGGKDARALLLVDPERRYEEGEVVK